MKKIPYEKEIKSIHTQCKILDFPPIEQHQSSPIIFSREYTNNNYDHISYEIYRANSKKFIT